MNNKSAILTAENICKSFGSVDVLKGVNFSLNNNEIHALMGENGAGKSTLIKIISGDYKKDKGSIKLFGSEIAFANPAEAIEAGFRVIHQEISLVKTMTVAENIFLSKFPKKKNRMIDYNKMNAEAQKVLHELDVPISPTEKVSRLTIAEQQIVEIAKAISMGPKVLIMDEPTAALNDQETSNLFNMLKWLRQSGVSIIYITHRFSEIYQLADRVTVLRDGVTIDTLDIKEVNDDKLVQMMVGQETNAIFKRQKREIGETIFSITNLSVEGALKNINLHINFGEIVVVFGLFGSGADELCRTIFGDLPIDEGLTVLNGNPLSIKSVNDACKSGIGYVSGDRKNDGIIPLLSVNENICLPALSGKLSSRLGVVDLKQKESLAQHYFNKLNIKCSGIQQQIGSLSGGNQQKCMIARWLANDAQLLILNMPTRGVDVGARAEIYRVLEDLAQQGVAVLIVSLEIPEVISIADRVYVMHEHGIVAELDAHEATQEKLLASALGVGS